MNQPLVDASPWELRLEEGDSVRFEASFLVDSLRKYQLVLACLFCLFPGIGQVWLVIFLLVLCCGFTRLLDRQNNALKAVITQRSLYLYKSKPACCCFAGLCWGHEQRYIPLDKIQDINIRQTWLEGKFGLFTVKIETAGQSGPEAGPEGLIQGMSDPIGFRQALLEARGRAPAPVAQQGDRELARVDHLIAGQQGQLGVVGDRLNRIEQVMQEQVTTLKAIEQNTRK